MQRQFVKYEFSVIDICEFINLLEQEIPFLKVGVELLL